MITLRIPDKNFKPFDELDPQPQAGKLYWLKLNNGDVVLSSWISTEAGASGWAQIEMTGLGELYASGKDFYLTRNALIQPAQTADLLEFDNTKPEEA